ncbi:centrosomal protein of 126 kDa [Cyprinodon tularosa]|uniref:centrosomal protein of 126 kDa n=1 Tax=Cyprinodon tularosa TaxID=77115 RepID=UPI0018E24315|nr:centrosomal protein of 126 kDa [Cyprinodon tularosa]
MQGSFSYLLHSRLGSDVNLEKERQHLIQQQKLSKARARKCLLETNRRRKALEERQKQLEIQEERLRENILQQRRQRVEDATKRFQRANLSPSQRYRQTFRNKATNIEDALSQIQSSLASYNQDSSALSTANTHGCPYSTKPPTDSKSSHRQALSAVEAYTKLLQEQCTIEEGSQHSDSLVSESLSSKDSLEDEDESPLNLHSSYSSFFLDSENQKKQTDLNSTSDQTAVSAMMLLDPNPAKLRKCEDCEPENQENSNRWTNNNMVVSKTSLRFSSEKRTPNVDNPLTLKHCDPLTRSSPLNRDSVHLMNSQSKNLLVTNEVGTVDAEEEALCPKKDPARSQINDSQLNYSSTQYNNFSHENSFPFESPMKKSTANDHPNDTFFFHIEKENFHLSSKKEICASINNLNKVSNLIFETEKPKNASLPSYSDPSNIQIETENCPKEEDIRLPISMPPSVSICDIRFLKGILKKQSKYTIEDPCLHDSGGLTLAKHVALAIRDSIELTRAKTKDVVVNNTMKKKLRWFDEVLPDKAGKEQNKMKQDKGMSHSLFNPKNGSKDHHQVLTTEAESSKPASGMTPTDPAGYHFTKEAWADVGVQVNLPQEQADEVKAQRTNTRTVGPKVPRRTHNATVVGGPISSVTRKGTVIRPQSAREVSQIVKTQGKIMVPRPPPRTEPMGEKKACIRKTPYGTNHPGIDHKEPLAAQEAQYKNNFADVFTSNSHPPVPADPTVMYTITPRSYPCPVCPHSDSIAKCTPSSRHQETHNSKGKGTMNEKGVCLHRTPTDEEILHVWHGVRSALNTKDDKPALKKQALESRRVCGKSCAEQSRQPPGSGSRRFLQSFQYMNQNSELMRPGPRNCNIVSRNEGFESAARLHMAEVHPEGLVKPNQTVAIMKAQRPEIAQQELTTLSFEEKKIMLSLDKLNHQLYCLKEHQVGRPGNNGQLIIGIPFTEEVKVSNNLKHRISSANQLHYQKKM